MFRTLFSGIISEYIIIVKRNAGHSKWQNIKHTKTLKDTQRSILFGRLGQHIKVAIQENGNNNNPDTNFQLSHAIEQAKKNNMPSSTIQNFLKSGQADKDKAKSTWYTVKGPKGSYVLILTLTTNMNKTKCDLAPIIKKNGGMFADSAKGLFDHKGFIEAVPPKDSQNSLDQAIEHALEVGAEDVKLNETEDNSLVFTCDAYQFHQARTKLTELNYTINKSELQYLAKVTVNNLTDNELETVARLIEKLEDHPDVVAVYDNIV